MAGPVYHWAEKELWLAFNGLVKKGCMSESQGRKMDSLVWLKQVTTDIRNPSWQL
jgi:hypothetical protein